MIFLAPVIVKYMKKIYLDKMKPHYSEHILSVPWPLYRGSTVAYLAWDDKNCLCIILLSRMFRYTGTTET